MTIFFTISCTAIAAWFYFGIMQLANFKSGILDYSLWLRTKGSQLLWFMFSFR